MNSAALEAEELRLIDAYWRAANYLSVGQIYLLDNPLLREPLRPEHIKPRLLGHWGTTPGQNFIYAHCNRVIKKHDLDMIYISGPGHGGPAWSPTPISKAPTARSIRTSAQDEDGHAEAVQAVLLSRRHPQPRRAGNARLDPRRRRAGLFAGHAFGAAFDNPDLIVACVIGDGEAETGPLATSVAFEQIPQSGRATAPCCPILHLNGYKIANPTVLARIPREELEQLLRGYGYEPLLRRGRRARCRCTG